MPSKKKHSRNTTRSSRRPASKPAPVTEQPTDQGAHLPTGGINWTLLGVLAIVAIAVVGMVGMVGPHKVGVEYEKGRVKGDIERYLVEDHTVPPKR